MNGVFFCSKAQMVKLDKWNSMKISIILQFSKWKFEFSGPNQILVFIFIYCSSK